MANLLESLSSDRVFYVAFANIDIGRLKSIHALVDKHLDYMLVKFEQKSYTKKYTNFLAKMVNYGWESVDAILEDVLVT